MSKHITTVGLIAFLSLGGLVLLTTPLWAVHEVSWAPSRLTQEVMAGEPINIPISVTAERSALPNTVIEVSQELAGFVTVEPSEAGTIPRGKSAALTMTINLPRTSRQGRIDGTIRLHKKATGEEFSPPLYVSIGVKWPSIANDGVAVTYPADWTLDQKVLDLGETIRITNFGTAYLSGGIVPEGGAQISAPVMPFSSDSLDIVIAQDTEGDQVLSRESIVVGGHPATKVVSEFEVGDDLRYRRVTVYVPRGSELNKFILDFRSGDQSETHFLQVFGDLLNSVTLD